VCFFPSVTWCFRHVFFGGGLRLATDTTSTPPDTAAVMLLDGLLTDGSSPDRPPTKCSPARVPPPQHLALLSNITIHPSHTSRASEPTHRHTAARARKYLDGVLHLVGPLNANMRTAFSFQTGVSISGRRGRDRERQRASPSDETSSLGSMDSDCVDSRFVNEQSVWRRGSDFWAVLGWAFRCAARHPHRWEHWRWWVEFMIGVLEADWDERTKLDVEQEGFDGDAPSMRLGSLLVGYIDDLRSERKNVQKEVIRTLMAFTDDDPSDQAVYREVFDRELALASKEPKRKRAITVVDLEKDQFGDYCGHEEEEDLVSEDEDMGMYHPPSPTPRKSRPTGRRRGKHKVKEPAAAPFRGPELADGVIETISLRLRLFRLLSAAADSVPDRFCKVADLYEMFSDRVRALPIPVFRLFIDTTGAALPDFIYPSFFRNLIMDLLPNNCPKPRDVDPGTDADDGISPAILRHCFLPFAANRVMVEDNAKLSLVLESMLWFIYGRDAMLDAEGLGAAVEKGIRAREEKTKRRAGREALTGTERTARLALERSARSLRVLVKVAGV